MADLEAGGYGSLEGMNVYIVVIVVASDMLLLFGKRAGGEVGGGCGTPVGKDAFGEAQEGKLGEFRQRVHLFFPSLLFCLHLVVANLQKIRILLENSIFLRFASL